MSRAGRRARRRAWRRLGRRLRERFPVVEGNALTSFELGSAYFERMLAAIEQACVAVDVEMYLWEDDDVGRAFCAALSGAVARGARVRILADAFGAREALRGPLRATSGAGADVRAFNRFRFPLLRRYYHRTHKKLLLVDGERAYCGGAGFSLHFSGVKHRERPWHDRMFEFRGPLVDQLATLFESDFGRWPALARPACGPFRATAPSAGSVGPHRGRVLRGWPDAREFPAELLRAVRGAERRILIGTPYFLPPRRLRRELRQALRRGVRVELVLPAIGPAHDVVWYASARHCGGLLRRGAALYEYGPEFYHAKLVVVDERCAFVGSSNLDAWSWRRNAELDVCLDDPAAVRLLAARFEADRARCQELTLEEHRSRGLPHRAFERLAGLLDPWL